LTDHEVNRRLHLILVIATLDFLLDEPDAEHVAEELRVELARVRRSSADESVETLASVHVTDHREMATIIRDRQLASEHPEFV